MRKTVCILVICISMLCCVIKIVWDKKEREDYLNYCTKLPSYTKDGRRINNTEDTIHVYDGYYSDLYDGGYEVLQPGDTVEDPIKEGYPDTIRVAFTRNGVFEDSVDVERVGGRFGYKYVYKLLCAVGDAFYYTRDGKFLGFVCVPEPHYGKGTYEHEHYRP